ncbi:hypothetical protein HETIRDRAFT_104919 [Heterobasidion irregulare TC 32-1]|uniref:Uncharacterized protein n=1 Tax=Heterobasidion irregulare (strain TC 32-1) TaxID=747525 RepID=W4K713_HETIT|nr:uncharacterized protein HETIRDRAFT_104919 [Heterobasidion irregulare TC 32-1]ETW81598.1 hypothetical protein HETIRDRAFT_104919 [Heterobasidion irregulare TC 32-1]
MFRISTYRRDPSALVWYACVLGAARARLSALKAARSDLVARGSSGAGRALCAVGAEASRDGARSAFCALDHADGIAALSGCARRASDFSTYTTLSYVSIANPPPLPPSPPAPEAHALWRSGRVRPPAGTANANESRKRIEQPPVAPSITASLSLSLSLLSRVAGPSSHRLVARASLRPRCPSLEASSSLPPFASASMPDTPSHAMSSARAISILTHTHTPSRPLPSAGRYIRVPPRSARSSRTDVGARSFAAATSTRACVAPPIAARAKKEIDRTGHRAMIEDAFSALGAPAV